MVIDNREIIEQLGRISKEFHDVQQEIMTQHPELNALKDARLTVFTNCYLVIDSVYVCLIVRSYELFDNKWWSKLRSENKISRRPSSEYE
jgi:hypothetical protein